MTSATILQAKTNLSDLIRRSQNGEEVIITSGRDKKPVARLVPLVPVKKQRLGLMYDPDFVATNAIFEPLPQEEQRLWDGDSEKWEVSS